MAKVRAKVALPVVRLTTTPEIAQKVKVKASQHPTKRAKQKAAMAKMAAKAVMVVIRHLLKVRAKAAVGHVANQDIVRPRAR